VTRREEWHVTVAGDPIKWHAVCGLLNIKPLYIELNTFQRQLMCAAPFNPCERIMQMGIPITRVKHEVESLLPGEVALYWECHLKFNGPFQHGIFGSSRDLYRADRWYLTHRQETEFDHSVVDDLAAAVTFHTTHPTLAWHHHPSILAGFEYEACVLDSNPELDSEWL